MIKQIFTGETKKKLSKSCTDSTRNANQTFNKKERRTWGLFQLSCTALT